MIGLGQIIEQERKSKAENPSSRAPILKAHSSLVNKADLFFPPSWEPADGQLVFMGTGSWLPRPLSLSPLSRKVIKHGGIRNPGSGAVW